MTSHVPETTTVRLFKRADHQTSPARPALRSANSDKILDFRVIRKTRPSRPVGTEILYNNDLDANSAEPPNVANIARSLSLFFCPRGRDETAGSTDAVRNFKE
jgi:hypothetical protein